MEIQQRFDRIAQYLADNFAGGNLAVSKRDIIDDRETELGHEVADVLKVIGREGLAIGRDHIVVDALSDFAAAWGQGFSLASGEDMVTDSENVADIICDYAASLKPTSSAAPSP